MELRDLQFFCLTAETQHVTRSAEKLGISQSSLTRIIGQIEQEVGGDLFEKVGRNIQLTLNGEVFYRYAKRVLDDIDVLITEMDYVFDRKERTVSLLCNTEAFATWMISEFQKTGPHYGISVLHALKHDMEEALISGESDFALCCPPIPDNDLIATEIAFYEKAIILLPAAHPLLKNEKVGINDIKSIPLVTSQQGSSLRSMIDSVFAEHGYLPQITCESNNINTIIRAVESGMGYAFVTKLIMQERSELLKNCRAVDLPENLFCFGLSYQKNSLLNRKTAHFRDFVMSALGRLAKDLYPDM